MGPKDNERIATLENESMHHASKISELSANIEEINKNVAEILQHMAGQKGFFHGVVFTLTIFGGLVGAVAAELWHRFIGH